jgi:hypothetical protein
MKHLASIIKFAATSAFVFAFVFEGQLGLGANLEANRNLMQDRIRVSQTVFGKVNERAVDANMVALDQYNGVLHAEYKQYGCDSVTRCR